jgi:hypothetical protein
MLLGLVPALALVLGAVGCVTEVSTGGDSEDGSSESRSGSEDGSGGEGEGGSGEGGGNGGSGGSAECTEYKGDCQPGDSRACADSTPPIDQACHVDVESCTTWWDSNDCNTPLVLSFDGAEAEFATDATRAFDVNGASSQVTDWPTAKTPWLALDRDGSGAIEDGRELFGSLSPLAAGGRAQNGFVALRELDENGDGRITAEDPGFAKLVVWSDRDADRASSPRELSSAAAWEIVSIDLAYVSLPRCDARGNCGVERAAFQYRDEAGALRTGEVIDVRLPPQR